VGVSIRRICSKLRIVSNNIASLRIEIPVKSRCLLLQDHGLSLNFVENSVDLSHRIVGYNSLFATTIPQNSRFPVSVNQA
jgi:hypothetical protein